MIELSFAAKVKEAFGTECSMKEADNGSGYCHIYVPDGKWFGLFTKWRHVATSLYDTWWCERGSDAKRIEAVFGDNNKIIVEEMNE